jgi:hypothetical protein
MAGPLPALQILRMVVPMYPMMFLKDHELALNLSFVFYAICKYHNTAAITEDYS